MTLIERLRCEAMEEHSSSCIAEAAAELEANAAEIGRKDAALEQIADWKVNGAPENWVATRSEMRMLARAALNKQESGNV